jgi:hypothetical protein
MDQHQGRSITGVGEEHFDSVRPNNHGRDYEDIAVVETVLFSKLVCWDQERKLGSTPRSHGAWATGNRRCDMFRTLASFALALVVSGCGKSSPTGPTPTATTPLPLVTETATTRYFYEAGDHVDIDLQEPFNAWAMDRLGVRPPGKIDYKKYLSRQSMGAYTGIANTNGFAEPEKFVLHTIWPSDNHEMVHVYTALIGRPSDFFNEGMAVSFQTIPAQQDFIARFNGQPVHEACRSYLASGQLQLPLVNYVTTAQFRAITDQELSYREAGSFMLFLTERYGMEAVKAFFRTGTRDDSLATIRSRFQPAVGVSLDQAAADWLAMLRS